MPQWNLVPQNGLTENSGHLSNGPLFAAGLVGIRCLRMSGMALVLGSLAIAGCGAGPAGGPPSQRGGSQAEAATAVDVAIARRDNLKPALEFTGTTQPQRQVSIRSQVEGKLLNLNVDVGDRVQQGQLLAQVDDSILMATVAAAEAELAARQSDILRAQTQVSEARTRVEQARLQLQQAEADAIRLENLSRDGAIPQQQAEQARTTAQTAAQVWRSAQEQVRNQQQAVTVAEKRLTAQQAVVAEVRRRRSFALINAPITGAVVAKVSEVGNLVQPGTEILKLGDFSRIKVLVQVSELDRGSLQLNGTATVRLDAFPGKTLSGTISRISPAADPTSRLIPVEVTIANPSNQIGSGLLARVSFGQPTPSRVVVPQTALQEKRRGKSSTANQAARPTPPAQPNRQTSGVLFVVSESGESPTVQSRQVKLGDRADGKVEILTGLQPGERFVVRSGKPLEDGEPIRLSILSE